MRELGVLRRQRGAGEARTGWEGRLCAKLCDFLAVTLMCFVSVTLTQIECLSEYIQLLMCIRNLMHFIYEKKCRACLIRILRFFSLSSHT